MNNGHTAYSYTAVTTIASIESLTKNCILFSSLFVEENKAHVNLNENEHGRDICILGGEEKRNSGF